MPLLGLQHLLQLACWPCLTAARQRCVGFDADRSAPPLENAEQATQRSRSWNAAEAAMPAAAQPVLRLEEIEVRAGGIAPSAGMGAI